MRVAPNEPQNDDGFIRASPCFGFFVGPLCRSRHQLSAVVNQLDNLCTAMCSRYAGIVVPPALKLPLRAAMSMRSAQILLASAYAPTLECRRVSICRVQLHRGPKFLSRRCMNTRAHWTSSLRRFLSPRLLIPSRFDRPPVLYCRGTSPIDAAKLRLRAYCLPSPIPAVSTLVVIGPRPGMVSTTAGRDHRRPAGGQSHGRVPRYVAPDT